MTHRPVLLNEVIERLNLRRGAVVLDATIDGGGHGREIIKRIMPGGKLVGIDQDKEILGKLELGKAAVLINGNFRDLDELLKNSGINFVDAAVFDLGTSSLQLEGSGRGFTFKKDEPLLMTYKSELRIGDLTAKEILNKWPENKIYEILREYGEERYARRISRAIASRRKQKQFETTFELVETIKESVPAFYRRARIHFATRTFQALRIAVNDELAALEEGLSKCWHFLNQGCNLAVISFHSLEDRIVKKFFRQKESEGEANILTKKPVVPTEEEIRQNPRSRSAKLRAAQKL